MKISTYTIHMLRTMAGLLFLGCAVSCSQADDFDSSQGDKYPPGKYPLMLTATVEGMKSRSTETDVWEIGDSIGVRIGDDNYEGCYELNTSGSVKKIIAGISWKNAGTANVTGWFPYKAVTGKDITDQSQGYHDINFMRAEAPDQSATKKVTLPFRHLMSKVSCKLVCGEGITEDNLKTAKVSYYGFSKATFSETVFSGDVNDWITPYTDFSALLVPQDMAGKPFIKINLTVTVNGTEIDKELIYRPVDDAALIEAGIHYRFTVTVKKDRLEVQSLSAEWKDDGKEHPAEPAIFCVKMPKDEQLPDLIYSDNVKEEDGYIYVKGNRFTISYVIDSENAKKALPLSDGSPRDVMTRSVEGDKYVFSYYLLSEKVTLEYVNYLQVGDYYYSDGSWGPPGLLGLKTPIGVVFKVGAGSAGVYDTEENYGWTEKKINGYAVALKDAVNDMIIWGSNKSKAADVYGSYDTVKYPIPYSGYKNTMKIKEWGAKGNAYEAAKAALDYEPKAPESSSGWYLPTPQQLIDIQNIPDRARLFTDVQGDDVKNGTIDKLNEKTGKIEKITLSYWSCLEVSALNAWIWSFDTGDPKVPKKDKSNELYVRAVLTF